MNLDFDSEPVIAAPNLFRAARVSSKHGDIVTERLIAEGVIDPIVTPTGRTIFTPNDGRLVFEALTKG